MNSKVFIVFAGSLLCIYRLQVTSVNFLKIPKSLLARQSMHLPCLWYTQEAGYSGHGLILLDGDCCCLTDWPVGPVCALIISVWVCCNSSCRFKEKRPQRTKKRMYRGQGLQKDFQIKSTVYGLLYPSTDRSWWLVGVVTVQCICLNDCPSLHSDSLWQKPKQSLRFH